MAVSASASSLRTGRSTVAVTCSVSSIPSLLGRLIVPRQWGGGRQDRHNGTMLTAVCFDLMGTVLYDPYLEAIEAATGMGIRDVLPVKDPDSWPQFEMGVIDEAEFARRFF